MKKTPADAQRSQAEFARKLQAGEVGPLYLFEGSERFLRAQALKKLAAAAVEASVFDFNYAEISVAQGNLDEALGLARQYPMISPRRMVVVRDFETISDETQIELLKQYLREPAETTVLVFVTDGMDNRRNIATMLKKACQVVSFDPLDDQQTTQWVRDYVTRAKCSIDPAAAAYLVGTVGVNLLQISNEVDKLINYVSADGGRKMITQREIDELVRHSREHSNFELTDAIVAGDRPKALRLLDRIYANTDESVQSLSLMILGAIASNYRRMVIAKDLMKQNLSNSEVAQAVGMSPYAVTYLNEKARRMEMGRLLQGIEAIARTDVALKSSLATPRLQMELLICELVGKSISR